MMPRVKRAPRRRYPGSRRPVWARRRAGLRRYRISRLSAPSTEYASLKETTSFNVAANTINYFNAYTLADLALQRAPRVAANYQYFKITKIEMKILTAFDTYPGGGAVRMPQVYWMINKGDSVPAGLGFDQLLQLGAKPRILNERNSTFKFRPGVMVKTREGGANDASMLKVSPWLATNANVDGAWAPNDTEHSGCILGVLPMAAGDQTLYQVQTTYHFKFKKPLVLVYEGQQVKGTSVIHDFTKLDTTPALLNG